ncbi:protein of unknown function [Prevotella jejuni]|uniref:DUF4280 domain-containing protein n=1 Tax=Prevotella jejuni TaxID=1177574 RepID=A0AA94ITI2_9BACT|nr:protein of unknown function [Prevotella jejuni]
MPKIITHGATLHCTLGVKESNLMVTSQTFRRIANTLVVTEGDNKGIVNIPSFGVCKCNSPKSSVYSPATSLAANYSERQYQWDENADGAVILYVC